MSDNENPKSDLTPFEAALAALQPRPDRLDPRWRALLVKEVSQRMKTAAHEPQPLEMTPCSAASDHVFACVYCGVRGPRIPLTRRWLWPAAFSVMTTLAASLLLMLLARPERQYATRENGESKPGNNLLAADLGFPPRGPGFEKLCYLGIRQQVLLHGVESWKLPESSRTLPAKVQEAPLYYRQQLNQFLNQPDSANL